MRDHNLDLDGYALAGALKKYSERGHVYVETLRSITKVNKLEQTDAAKLIDTEVIKLIPVGGGTGTDCRPGLSGGGGKTAAPGRRRRTSTTQNHHFSNDKGS